MNIAQAKAQLPQVGERRLERATIADPYPGKRAPQLCSVVEVNRRGLWYRVVFDKSGCSECFKVPNIDPNNSRKVNRR